MCFRRSGEMLFHWAVQMSEGKGGISFTRRQSSVKDQFDKPQTKSNFSSFFFSFLILDRQQRVAFSMLATLQRFLVWMQHREHQSQAYVEARGRVLHPPTFAAHLVRCETQSIDGPVINLARSMKRWRAITRLGGKRSIEAKRGLSSWTGKRVVVCLLRTMTSWSEPDLPSGSLDGWAITIDLADRAGGRFSTKKKGISI